VDIHYQTPGCIEEIRMSFFLVEASYTSEVLAAMMQNPEDRTSAVRSLVENIGRTIRDSGSPLEIYVC